ncbi:hypothetical protein LSAT2_009398 [Lamellibrachia satsuma]|nr:hypothetical protein LSAT2_009398 [Lamellibrachia satsuma]
MKLNIMLILLSTALMVRPCSSGRSFASIYRSCMDMCKKQFNSCIRRCPTSGVENCKKELKICNDKCKNKFNPWKKGKR